MYVLSIFYFFLNEFECVFFISEMAQVKVVCEIYILEFYKDHKLCKNIRKIYQQSWLVEKGWCLDFSLYITCDLKIIPMGMRVCLTYWWQRIFQKKCIPKILRTSQLQHVNHNLVVACRTSNREKQEWTRKPKAPTKERAQKFYWNTCEKQIGIANAIDGTAKKKREKGHHVYWWHVPRHHSK